MGLAYTCLLDSFCYRYHNNWIVDNLPSAHKVEDEEESSTRYWHGFPVGYVSDKDQKAYIHNHGKNGSFFICFVVLYCWVFSWHASCLLVAGGVFFGQRLFP